MKIRTDFVTNSSSYSSSTIIIDNPVLLEILKRYSEMGTFEDWDPFSIGNYEDFEISIDISDEDLPTCPAFAFGTKDGYFICSENPTKLSEVVESILHGIGINIYSPDKENKLFEQLESEVKERREEIMSSYKKVIWNYKEDTNEDDDFSGHTHSIQQLVYDPVAGEEYRYTREVTWSAEKDIEEGTLLDEKLVLNGKVIKDFKFKRGDQE